MSSQLQHKLQNFEATPRGEVWKAIEEELGDVSQAISERLSAFETTPPAMVWNRLERELDTYPEEIAGEQEHIRLTSKKWFRYSVAAVVLGIIVLSAATFAVDQPQKTSVVQQATIQKQTQAAAVSPVTSIIPEKKSTNNDSFKDQNPGFLTDPTGSSLADVSSAATNRYKLVANEDGQLVRLSQKASAVFDCALKAAANKSIRCKENIATMQEKMATSMVAPTTDFAGLIDMIKTLEENK